jgi:hypothetical protein
MYPRHPWMPAVRPPAGSVDSSFASSRSRLRLGPLWLSLGLGLGAALACGKNAGSDADRGQTGAGGAEAGDGAGGNAAPAITTDGGVSSAGPPDAKPADPLNASACQSLQTGPFVTVTGQSTFSIDAPAIKSDRQVYRIGIAKRNAAHVSFQAPAAGVYVIYTSTPAPLAVFALDGTMIEINNLRMSIPECGEVKGRHTVTLKQDGHIIRVGPDMTAASVDVLVTPAAP